MSQQEVLDQATIHIKNLQERIQSLKAKKDLVLKSERRVEGSRGSYITELSPPVVEVRNLASGIEVVLATGIDRTFKLSDAITILNEEGVDVKYAGFSVAGCRVFCTIHSQLAIPRLESDCGRMRERLKLLVQ
ncbi:transcription factor bHLH167-like [Aristolochia californica]|uniref:transcription factor bHLH167-like n=1 Tax=Aristolochia californica TaxID=171875 RepID=UPI0035E1D071